VGYDDKGYIFHFVEVQQDIFYLLASFAVKVSSRLISENYFRFHDKCPRDGNPLLLASGKLTGFVG